MLDAVDARILLDVYHIGALALVVGLITFGFIRRSNPLLRWHEHGDVWTQPFGWMELKITLIFIALFYLMFHGILESAGVGSSPAGEGDGSLPPPEDPERKLRIQLVGIVGTVIYHLVVAGGVVAFLAHVRDQNIYELFGLRRLRWPQLLIKVLLGLVIGTVLAVATFYLWNLLIQSGKGEAGAPQEAVRMLRESESIALKLGIAFSAVIVAPVAEEILFRGFMYPSIKRFSDRFFAAAITSLFFAFIHFNAGSLAPLFVLAMVLTIAYEVTGCLLVPIGIHAAFNLFQVVGLFFFPFEQ